MSWKRIFVDMAYDICVIIVMTKLVFGIILEGFANLRAKKEENERLSKTKCMFFWKLIFS